MCEFDSAARVAVEGGDLAATLPRVPSGVDWSPTSEAFEQADGTNDIYLAAWRETQGGERYAAVNDNFRTAPRAGAIDNLPAGIIYLGSPYSLQASQDEAAELAALAAARLMQRGSVVYAPIPHGHTIAEHGLPESWAFWKRQCDPFIDAASALVVLKLDGWRESVGLNYEIARFHEAGKPIVYVTMEDVVSTVAPHLSRKC